MSKIYYISRERLPNFVGVEEPEPGALILCEECAVSRGVDPEEIFEPGNTDVQDLIYGEEVGSGNCPGCGRSYYDRWTDWD